jgi:hypothetical protein
MASEMIEVEAVDAMEAWIESDDGAYGPADESELQVGVRAALAPEYEGLPAEELDAIVERVLESATPEDAELIENWLTDIGRAVLPIAKQLLPVAAPIVGGVIGGPAGAAVGQAVAQVAGQAFSGATPGAPQHVALAPAVAPIAGPVVRDHRTQVPAVASASPALPAAPVAPSAAPAIATTTAAATAPAAPAGGGMSSALAQLLALLEHPAFRQLLGGQLLGSAGARAVPVGAEGVPVTFPAIMEALSVLAEQAGAEAAEHTGGSGESESTAYLRDASGAYRYDPASPEERAAALVEQLRSDAAWRGGFGEASDRMNGSEEDRVGEWLARAGLVT